MYNKNECIICKDKTKNDYLFCADCFRDVKERANNLNFFNEQTLRNYYFDLRDKFNNNEYNLNQEELFNNKISLLYALAINLFDDFDDDYLILRVENDILQILKNQTNNNDEKSEENKKITKKEEKQKEINNKNSNCLFCNEPTKKGYLFCKDCFHDINILKNNFNHNRSEENITDHYFKLKSKINESSDLENEIDNIKLMYALALELENIYDTEYLSKRVELDILNIIESIKNNVAQNKNDKNNFNDIDFRENWPREYQCEDGHYVRSLSEMNIDNWLYNHNYVHAYEKSVYMESDPDAIVLSDFYLPQGELYIEFWGLTDDEKYSKRKETKINLYDTNNYKRLDLYEKDIKRLNDILPRELGKYIKRK